jgi:probable phosphoglycerate mutase
MDIPARHSVWLVRHGETEWSASRRHTGRTDIPLTPIGEQQAERLSRILGAREFALVLTSPLARARETCRLAGYAAAARVVDELVEWDYGDFEGRTTADIRRERPGWTVWDDAPTNGESVEHVGERADRVIALARAAPGDVLIFAHAHLLRVLAARWIGLAARAGRSLALETASISVLGHEREEPVLQSWNQHA